MGGYILRRLMLMIPPLIGIMAISFVVVQFAPGGPVEQVIAELTGQGNNTTERISGGNDLQGAAFNEDFNSQYRGAQGLDPEFIKSLEKQFGFDKPPLERFLGMLWDYARFDFGESFFRNIEVIDLIAEKLPVSISLGVWILLSPTGFPFRSASARRSATDRASTSGPPASSSSLMLCPASCSVSC